MWRKLPNSVPQFFLSFTNNNRYSIYITDFLKIWWVHYNEKEFLNILKKSNDDLEMENDEEFVQLGLKILSQPENLKKVVFTIKDETLNITLTLICGFPVYLELKLTEGSKEMFFEKITQPLLKTIYDLKASETELRSSLIKKDKEIEEYKSETDVRLAMYLKTGTFRDEEHMGKHPMYEKIFGTSYVSNCLLEKNIEGTEDKALVKQEHQAEELKIKMEIDSQSVIKTEMDSVPQTDTQNPRSTEPIKREIKNEPINASPRKKLRKLLRI